MLSASFVAVDWGTSSFRLWGLSSDNSILGKRVGPFGMSTLKPDEFVSVLEENLLALEIDSDCPVIVCGMAGAAQGWCEAPYVDTSSDLFTLRQHAVRVPNIKRSVHILPGVKQLDPANVMRGEETQLLGLLHTQPGFDGVVCLPGTHTKWAEIREGRIKKFTTHMSGELFALLSTHSVLKHSVERVEDAGQSEPWNASAFEQALRDVMEKPTHLIEQLFSLRASTLLENVSPAVSSARLSGLLIGMELVATQTYWNERDVALIGDTKLCKTYAHALKTVGINPQIFDAETLTLNGLTYAFHQTEKSNNGA